MSNEADKNVRPTTVEALAAAVTNGSALSLEGKGVWGEGENINGGIRTAELDKK